MQTIRKMRGNATKMPAIKNGTNEPSLSTLIVRSGIQPIGLVFLIMNESVMVAVRQTVLNVNLSF